MRRAVAIAVLGAAFVSSWVCVPLGWYANYCVEPVSLAVRPEAWRVRVVDGWLRQPSGQRRWGYPWSTLTGVPLACNPALDDPDLGSPPVWSSFARMGRTTSKWGDFVPSTAWDGNAHRWLVDPEVLPGRAVLIEPPGAIPQQRERVIWPIVALEQLALCWIGWLVLRPPAHRRRESALRRTLGDVRSAGARDARTVPSDLRRAALAWLGTVEERGHSATIACAALLALGLTVAYVPIEYRVNFRDGGWRSMEYDEVIVDDRDWLPVDGLDRWCWMWEQRAGISWNATRAVDPSSWDAAAKSWRIPADRRPFHPVLLQPANGVPRYRETVRWAIVVAAQGVIVALAGVLLLAPRAWARWRSRRSLAWHPRTGAAPDRPMVPAPPEPPRAS